MHKLIRKFLSLFVAQKHPDSFCEICGKLPAALKQAGRLHRNHLKNERLVN